MSTSFKLMSMVIIFLLSFIFGSILGLIIGLNLTPILGQDDGFFSAIFFFSPLASAIISLFVSNRLCSEYKTIQFSVKDIAILIIKGSVYSSLLGVTVTVCFFSIMALVF